MSAQAAASSGGEHLFSRPSSIRSLFASPITGAMPEILLPIIPREHPDFGDNVALFCTIGAIDYQHHLLRCRLLVFLPSSAVAYLPFNDGGMEDCFVTQESAA